MHMSVFYDLIWTCSIPRFHRLGRWLKGNMECVPERLMVVVKVFRRECHRVLSSERTTVHGADSMLRVLQLAMAEVNKQVRKVSATKGWRAENLSGCKKNIQQWEKPQPKHDKGRCNNTFTCQKYSSFFICIIYFLLREAPLSPAGDQTPSNLLFSSSQMDIKQKRKKGKKDRNKRYNTWFWL